jgi:signal transduction histidine kinase/integral membrane sensor domain MASE1
MPVGVHLSSNANTAIANVVRHRLRDRTPLEVFIAVALSYYLGVQVGLELRFPPAVTSVLWPPNAIVTAALLLTPVRLWWVCLAAVLPIHVALEIAIGWPMAMILPLFVTNCSEALIAAAVVVRFSDSPVRFDTMSRVGVFLMGAGIAGPALSSFGDAAVVHLVQGEPYWTVWQTRVLANALTELSVVPLVILLITEWGRDLITGLRGRLTEVSLFAVSLLAVATVVFWNPGLGWAFHGVPRTPVALLLPVFFWGALRFGAPGLSAALLSSAVVASLAARAGSRAFDALSPNESLMALQLFFIVMTIPLFVVVALLNERRLALHELASQLQLEALLAWVTGRFVQMPTDQMGDTFGACLERAGQFFAVDRALIVQVSPTGTDLEIVRQWAAPGVPRLPDNYACSQYPWVVGRILGAGEVICNTIDALPPDAARDRQSFVDEGLQSAAVIPLMASGKVFGAVCLHMTQSARIWRNDLVARLRLVAEVFGHALERQRADDALRVSESMKTAILASLSSLVAVLDRDGVIIAANEGWRRVAGEAVHDGHPLGIGTNYLAAWRHLVSDGAVAPGGPEADRAFTAIQQVLSGETAGFAWEYSSSRDDGRWHAMTVVPLRRPEGGAVVTHVDITERKRAELDAQHARQELAHFSRVSTIGELTASLAHQLNQPLTGIRNNAEAAGRILTTKAPDLSELGAIVADIIEDDKRAAEIIGRMRAMMTKSGVELIELDLNALIRDVASLMKSDAIIRNVSLAFDLAPSAPRVRGDRIGLQQVLLNLIVNAIEAVAVRPVRERRVLVRTRHGSNGTAVISIQDSGSGIRPDVAREIFEPFFTTKAGGMGMGLTIARSIVESYGGDVRAENNPDRGATVIVALPAASGCVR